MTTYNVTSSQSSSSITLNNGDYEYVHSGGVASGTTVNSGGTEDISSGGMARGTTVNGGGNQLIEYGGVASGSIVKSGGTIDISSEGMATGASVNSGGNEFIENGGIANNTVVSRGGAVDIESGGLTTRTTVNSGGNEFVYSGGVASGSTLNNGGSEDIISSGLAIAITVNDGGNEYVGSGGLASGTLVNGGGTVDVTSGGLTTGTIVNSGGYEYVDSTGVASGTVISGGMVEFVGQVTSDQAVVFVGGSGNISLDDATNFSGTILGFGVSDIIDLTNIVSIKSVAWNNGSLAISVVSGGTVNLTLPGNYQGATFGFGSDNLGGTQITLEPAAKGMPPTIYSANYIASANVLSLSGGNLSSTASSYKVTDFTLKGDGGVSYTLTSGSKVAGTPTSSSVTIQLSTADQQSIGGLLNKNGVQAYDGSTTYNLSTTSGWDAGATAITTQGIAVINITVPTISSVSYNAASGVFIFTGNNLVKHGASVGIMLNDFTLTGGSSGSYVFSSKNDTLSNFSSKSFMVSLSSVDKALVNTFVNANGTVPSSGSAYNINAKAYWDTDSSSSILTQSVLVSGGLPTINSIGYDASSGKLSLSGNYLSATAGDYKVTNFSLTGDGNTKYTLTSGSKLANIPNSSSMTIQLSPADQLAADGLLNQSGTHASSGILYQLSSTKGWDTGANAIVNQGITVSNVTPPTIATATYNPISGVFSITGNNIVNHGSSNGIALASFKLSGSGNTSYTFNVSDKVSNLNSNGFNITLSSPDINNITKNFGSQFSGSNINLMVKALWNSDSGAAISAQHINVVYPSINSVGYDVTTGQLNLSGSNLAITASSYKVSDFTLTGDGSVSYTLMSSKVIPDTTLNGNTLTIQLSSMDQLAIDGLLNKNGLMANDHSTTYNLSLAAGWETGTQKINTLGVTVSNVSAPTISKVNYNAGTGVFTFNGSNLVNHGNSNGIALGDFTLSGGTNSTYTFNPVKDKLSNFSTSGFTIALSSADQKAVNAIINNNGSFSASGTTYKIVASANWDSNSGVAISNQTLTASGVASHIQTLISSGLNQPIGITKIPSSSNMATTILSTGLNNPSSIALDRLGNIYIADNHNNAIKELVVGSNTATTILSTGLNSPIGITLDSSGNLYVTDKLDNDIKEVANSTYLLNSPLVSETPTTITTLFENTQQIQLSKTIFTAFAGENILSATDFRNTTNTHGSSSLYYDSKNGGLFYEASGAIAAIEIAIVGVSSHPTALSVGDFKLVA